MPVRLILLRRAAIIDKWFARGSWRCIERFVMLFPSRQLIHLLSSISSVYSKHAATPSLCLVVCPSIVRTLRDFSIASYIIYNIANWRQSARLSQEIIYTVDIIDINCRFPASYFCFFVCWNYLSEYRVPCTLCVRWLCICKIRAEFRYRVIQGEIVIRCSQRVVALNNINDNLLFLFLPFPVLSPSASLFLNTRRWQKSFLQLFEVKTCSGKRTILKTTSFELRKRSVYLVWCKAWVKIGAVRVCR